jgi:PAB-dependent poly(A)-specific ribonuclease subunit 2
VGCADGRIRLLDGRLRARRVEKNLDAHSGNVLSMVFDEDGMTLASCGMIGRSINPYDPRSPKTYQPDHVVRLFDLRMMCQRAPLPVEVPAPFMVAHVPQDCVYPRTEKMEHDFLTFSTDGYMQTCALEDSLDVQYTHPTNEMGISAATVSSSGDYVAVACGDEIIQFRRQIQEAGHTERVVNHHSLPIEHPETETTLEQKSLPLSTYSLGTSYFLSESGSSSLFKGSICKRVINTHSSSTLSEDFLSKVSYQPGSFIGTANRPKDVKSNSMLFGDMERAHSTRTYVVTDPRKADAIAEDDSGDVAIPPQYRRVVSHRGKQRMNQFDYKSFNSEGLVGLENALQNSRFMNATLQMLFLIPEICSIALKSQCRDYHHRKQTVWCELGCLIQMMMTIQKSADADPLIPRIAIASNFERTFKTIPEAVALNLFDLKNEAKATSNEATQNRIQTFSRFILQHLRLEADVEKKDQGGNAKDVIDDIFGFGVITKKTFIQSGTQEMSTGNRLLGLDIIYPAPCKNKSTADGNVPSFASILYGSIKKETSVRGWCAASQTYEPLRQARTLDTSKAPLPKVLGVSCGETTKDVSEGTLENIKKVAESHHHTYWSKTNKIGGSWLPVEIEVMTVQKELEEVIISERLAPGAAGGADEWLIYDKTERMSKVPASVEMADKRGSGKVNFVRYCLFAVISQITSGKPSWSHSVVHTRSLSSGASDGTDGWRLLNDFRIQSCTEREVTTFDPRRHPCMLYFAREDYQVGSFMRSEADTKSGASVPAFTPVSIPDSVLKLPSLSPHSSMSALMLKTQKGDLIAFDAEFVSVEVERSELNSSGHRVVSDEGRQVLARISLVSEDGKVMLDDYILPSEPIVDYVTRFSGLTADDLDPQHSKHAVVDSRTAFLKLRYLLDKGCIFIGHGLQKDFETANLFVPPEQIRDTVELWRLPAQRKISLRFLAGHVLKSMIQDEIHDSIEDAVTALHLFKRHRELTTKGGDALEKALDELYTFGNMCNWTLGLEGIDEKKQIT